MIKLRRALVINYNNDYNSLCIREYTKCIYYYKRLYATFLRRHLFAFRYV